MNAIFWIRDTIKKQIVTHKKTRSKKDLASVGIKIHKHFVLSAGLNVPFGSKIGKMT